MHVVFQSILPKWYPTFDLDKGGCINDGFEPVYMKRFSEFTFDSMEECCKYYYPMNVNGCRFPSIKDPCSAEFEAAVSVL